MYGWSIFGSDARRRRAPTVVSVSAAQARRGRLLRREDRRVPHLRTRHPRHRVRRRRGHAVRQGLLLRRERAR